MTTPAPRTRLRQAFVAHLRVAIPSLAERVYAGRLMPIEEPAPFVAALQPTA
jgi:hypothetical protein